MMSGSNVSLEGNTDIGHTFGANISELDASGRDELQGFVDVFCLLNAHSWGFVISPERNIAFS